MLSRRILDCAQVCIPTKGNVTVTRVISGAHLSSSETGVRSYDNYEVDLSRVGTDPNGFDW